MVPPIVILGLPRSGTRLVARLLGQLPGVVLTTEHKQKTKIPEDRSGVSDNVVWREAFRLDGRLEEVTHDADAEWRLRRYYAALGKGHRLIIKNPNHLARLETVKRILPEANFIWIARGPWKIIESSVRGCMKKATWWKAPSDSFLLRTRQTLQIPARQVIPRAAAGLFQMADLFELHSGPVIRYEEILQEPMSGIRQLYKAAGFCVAPSESALALPVETPKDTESIRYEAARTPMAQFIDECVQRYATTFGY